MYTADRVSIVPSSKNPQKVEGKIWKNSKYWLNLFCFQCKDKCTAFTGTGSDGLSATLAKQTSHRGFVSQAESPSVLKVKEQMRLSRKQLPVIYIILIGTALQAEWEYKRNTRQIRESPFPCRAKKWPIKNVDLQYVGLFSCILINAFTLSGWWRCEVPYSKPAAGPAAQRNLGSFSFSWCGLSQILWRETHDSPHHQPVLVRQRETRTPASEPTERQQRGDQYACDCFVPLGSRRALLNVVSVMKSEIQLAMCHTQGSWHSMEEKFL